MKRLFLATPFVFLPAVVFANGFDRPIPQPQSAAAEFWFFLASLTLIAALAAVGWLVSKR
ncbi:hypothetical protein [Pseudophaeobacter arcticus]|jgi:hypothetical protein|uniref:hypothetical protein n=1 Tax=Pseudophaeobacter arcticus TaxID=385492 RepID=UPI0003FCEF36|nr:hypothetical protein [Pseudophaeobacter arcticus]